MAAQVLTFSSPSTPSTTFTVGSSSNPSYSAVTQMQPSRGGNAARPGYTSHNSTGYRASSAHQAPMPSYAFTATPQLNSQTSNGGRHQSRDKRSASSSSGNQRPFLALDLNGVGTNASKPSPTRYKQTGQRQGSGPHTPTLATVAPSGSGMASVNHLYQQSPQNYFPAGPPRTGSADDLHVSRHGGSDQAKRYRRRSINSIGHEDPTVKSTAAATTQMPRTYAAVASASYVPERQQAIAPPKQQYGVRPSSAHGRNNSNESSGSSVRSTSRPRSARRETKTGSTSSSPPAVPHNGVLSSSPSSSLNAGKASSSAARGTASDANKRHTNPSPLSQPLNMAPDSPSSPIAAAASGALGASTAADSPAARHLAALNEKEEAKKGGKPSRLRRAFSFGSAAELRKASAANNHENNERAKLQKPQYKTEEEAREAAIVQQQEAAGLGASIYSGQGNFFTGSTDNLSVSSTASSASIMLRKMGKGMKKGTKSFVGLFRPKSVIGVPAADAAVPEPSMAQVSMVTVEAERENVNVNVDPHDRAGGGTGFPKLERNSVDAARSSLVEGSDSRSRRSIVGGEQERAEVLAAVKKGILKRNGPDSAASSPSVRPADPLKPASDYVLPQIPRFSDSPVSSTPSTPRDDSTPGGHRRDDSLIIHSDYFSASLGDLENKSVPGTPRGVKGITFSPKIQFHDTWPSGEYDRRGDIATCNRLTPILAQQIKEELNSFKMEMEVHESSKIYTHFF